MRIGIRERIVLITTAILLLAVGMNTLIGTRLFRTSYVDTLQSEMYVICLNLKSQLERVLRLGISVQDVEGFEQQCQDVVADHDEVAYAMIARTDGTILFHSVPSSFGARISDPKLLAALDAKRPTICESAGIGPVCYLMVLPVENGGEDGPGIAAVIGVPTTTVNARTQHLMSLGVATGLLLSVAAIMVLLTSLSATVIGPLSRLTATIQDITANSDLSKRVEVTSSDELGVLAASFNRMTEDLQKTTTSMDNLNREIAIRCEAEKKQTELIEQVKEANRELTEFAYVASHDLKAPLRGIRTLAEWIHNDCHDKLDADNQERLDLLISRVERMHSLIEGILQYSRVGQAGEDTGRVDIRKLLAGIVDMIQPPEHIHVLIESPMPVVEISETRIGQVFQNLLSNAVKYMDKPQGLVRVGCVSDGAFWRFSVSDNGPGIEPQHFEKIFRIFQTLNRKDEYESTGIGLTIAKKIVEQYGGRIWVESQVGQGTTFLFTLPKTAMETSDEHSESAAAC